MCVGESERLTRADDRKAASPRVLPSERAYVDCMHTAHRLPAIGPDAATVDSRTVDSSTGRNRFTR